jgi:hypothetical protein
MYYLVASCLLMSEIASTYYANDGCNEDLPGCRCAARRAVEPYATPASKLRDLGRQQRSSLLLYLTSYDAASRKLMLPTVWTPRVTRRAALASASIALLLAAGGTGSRTLIPACSAQRFSHHKSSVLKAGTANASTTSSSRNASYASGGGGFESVDNPFKMDRPLNVFGRPLAQCGTNPITGFYRDGVSFTLKRRR